MLEEGMRVCMPDRLPEVANVISVPTCCGVCLLLLSLLPPMRCLLLGYLFHKQGNVAVVHNGFNDNGTAKAGIPSADTLVVFMVRINRSSLSCIAYSS